MVMVLPRKKSACACALPDCAAPSRSDAKTTTMRAITLTSTLSCRAYCTRCGGRQIAPVSRRYAPVAHRERPEQLARAVGFEPTIPDLETGALDQAKLRPYRCRYVALCKIGPWEPSRT